MIREAVDRTHVTLKSNAGDFLLKLRERLKDTIRQVCREIGVQVIEDVPIRFSMALIGIVAILHTVPQTLLVAADEVIELGGILLHCVSRSWPNSDLSGRAEHVRSARLDQTSICSAIAKASSTSMPRYLTVLSILVCPSRS